MYSWMVGGGGTFVYKHRWSTFPPITSGGSTVWANYSSGSPDTPDLGTLTEQYYVDTFYTAKGARDQGITGADYAGNTWPFYDIRDEFPPAGWEASDVAPLQGLSALRSVAAYEAVSSSYRERRRGAWLRQDATTHDLCIIGGGWPIFWNDWIFPLNVSDVLGMPFLPGTFSSGRTLSSPLQSLGRSLSVTVEDLDPIDTVGGSYSDTWRCSFYLPYLKEDSPSTNIRGFTGRFWLSPSVGTFVRMEWRDDLGSDEANYDFFPKPGGTPADAWGYQLELTEYHHGPPVVR